MTRGLVIGKFMPVHQGHLGLIRFAAAQCDKLIVSMSYKPGDPIDGPARFKWVEESVADIPNASAHLVVDDFDDESQPWQERTRIWARALTARYGRIDRIFSSEAYGTSLASHLRAENVVYDMSRIITPVSATQIRQNPFLNWGFIPPAVRPYFVKKVCFYGPESTGKSVLAVKLAQVYATEFVPEVAREMITSNSFTVEDIIRIGKEQTARVERKQRTANKILFCDTDVITTQIYCRTYLGVVPDVLFEMEKKVSYDQYFLFNNDVAWVADGMRDLGARRDEMYAVFRKELDQRHISYVTVGGDYAGREALVRGRVDQMLAGS